MNINNNQTIFRSLFTGARRGLLAAGLLLLGSPAQATSPGFMLESYPDIISQIVGVEYNYTPSGLFTATGYALGLDNDGSGLPEDITDGAGGPGNFSLIAFITGDGTFSSGTLKIDGEVPTLTGFDSGTLLTGNLTAFDFPAPGDGQSLGFLFDVTGGDAAGLFGGNGPGGGVILTGTGYGGQFDPAFECTGLDGTGSACTSLDDKDFSGTGNADTGVVVPEPATVWLIGSGLLLLGLGRRRRLA